MWEQFLTVSRLKSFSLVKSKFEFELLDFHKGDLKPHTSRTSNIRELALPKMVLLNCFFSKHTIYSELQCILQSRLYAVDASWCHTLVGHETR